MHVWWNEAWILCQPIAFLLSHFPILTNLMQHSEQTVFIHCAPDWMKMQKHKFIFFCALALCVFSQLHNYKALHHMPILSELYASSVNALSFLWRGKGNPSNNAHPERRPLPGPVPSDTGLWEPEAYREDQGNAELGRKIGRGSEDPWRTEQPDSGNVNRMTVTLPKPKGPWGELHKRSFHLSDDPTPFFVRTKSGEYCFREGTEMTSLKDHLGQKVQEPGEGQRKILHAHQEEPKSAQEKTAWGKRLGKCMCRPGWHGPHCGIPTMVQHSNLPTKARLTVRKVPRRVINAININHEFDLLHARFHELADAVDLFLVCESNFTAYGNSKPLYFLHLLLNGTYNYVHHKILYVFLDHFPKGGQQNGWIADDYLRTFLSRDGMSRVQGARPDDVFLINDADEIPAREGILFLKLYDGWTEPVSIHMRKSLYGFFWRQPGTLDVLSVCTVAMLFTVYNGDGILLRRREYFSMPGFRNYQRESGHILVQWSIGSPVHYAGWHCSWCFRPEGISQKLISAQNGDFPRWGDYVEKRDLNYIKGLIRTGGWFDGSVGEYPPTNPKEPMYAPKYLLKYFQLYRYVLDNPYA
ncbi:beta-1,4-mannosyl-glycoprotein 4-beta-N-acetylglucosaminyltransferase isoform X1 [Salmo trutta]|uniref:beta-1,4-mannosyl-glycoprotein 4-beta-N-acetylglucosaminyltransferase isoform X1 n=2 Tax=Salmo trutta TaxID=8032 RepID=UPI0011301683|nr:beta-1,4-mannosyl-glycoprotein 4-beta-N-acetylglucosaminyltransferase-like isoform X1 [Salmo trutta]